MAPDTASFRALALPETVEVDHLGCPSFRVAGMIFAQLSAARAFAPHGSPEKTVP